jgi:hypothetical protein
MKAETKSQWVAALRSGQYKQGHHRLRMGDTYCCLGVFCDLFGGGHWEQKSFPLGTTYRYKTSHNDDKLSYYIPREICEVHNLNFGEAQKLSIMNDDGYTFEQIADYIQTHL